jgi:hypothetical protein
MRRLLALLLPLVLMTVATVTPAIACVSDTAAIGTPHNCCGEQQGISAAPVGTCCVLSAPTSERALVESRLADGRHHATHLDARLHSVSFHEPADRVDPPGGSPPRLHVRTTPLYLQQLALLI